MHDTYAFSGSEDEVIFASARALANLGDGAGFDIIKKKLETDISRNEMEDTLEALGKLGTSRACDVLIEQFEQHIKSGSKTFLIII